jgi:hypothetical protein
MRPADCLEEAEPVETPELPAEGPELEEPLSDPGDEYLDYTEEPAYTPYTDPFPMPPPSRLRAIDGAVDWVYGSARSAP